MIEKIKTALKAAGLGENLNGLIKVDAEADIAAAVSALKSLIPTGLIPQIAKCDKKDYVSTNEFLTDLVNANVQSETDRRVKLYVDNQKLEADKKAAEELAKKAVGGTLSALSGDPEILALKESLKLITDFMTQQNAATLRNGNKVKAVEMLKKEKLNEAWADRLDLSKDNLDEQVSEIKLLVNGDKQTIVNDYLKEKNINPETGTVVPQAASVVDVMEAAKAKNMAEGFTDKK